MRLLHRSLLVLTTLAVAAGAPAVEPLILTKTIPLKGVEGKLDHLAADSKGGRVFVANKPNNTLDIVDLKTGTMVKQITDQGKVSGVAYASDLDMVYVGNGAGTCNGFSCKEGYAQVFSTKLVDADNVQYYATTKIVYVGHGKTLTGLDAKTGEVKGSIEMPGGVKGFRFDKKDGKIFVVLSKPNMVAVVDMATNKIDAKFPLTLSDGGSPIAYDADGGRIYVGCPKKAMIIAFDAKTGKELSSVVIPGGVDDVHFDSKRNRLIASCADGFLTVVERKADAYEVVGKIETPKNSRTCAWGGDKVYLGVPKRDGSEPEVRVYESRPLIEAKEKK